MAPDVLSATVEEASVVILVISGRSVVSTTSGIPGLSTVVGGSVAGLVTRSVELGGLISVVVIEEVDIVEAGAIVDFSVFGLLGMLVVSVVIVFVSVAVVLEIPVVVAETSIVPSVEGTEVEKVA